MKDQKIQRKAIDSYDFPDSQSAEEIVTGSVLFAGTSINEIADFLTPSMFYDEKLGKIYACALELYEENKAVDMLSVTGLLRRKGSLEEIGGPVYIASLTENIYSTVNIKDHAMYVMECSLRRKTYFESVSIGQKALDFTEDISDVIDAGINHMEDISKGDEIGSTMVSIKESVRGSLEEYGKREVNASKGLISGIRTGLKKLDRIIGGFQPQQFTILAGRPAQGKTAMMLHFALAAARSGASVLIFTLEMSNVSLANRLLIAESGVDSESFKRGVLNDEERRRICNASDRLAPLKITIDDKPETTLRQIKNKAQKMKRKGMCDIIMIDYLQLVDMRSDNRSYTREQEVAQCSRKIKLLAKALNVPVVILSQLSRENERREKKIPVLSDLRESGAIEQDADVVLFIHRPEYYSDSEEKGKGNLFIAKNRDGMTGKIDFSYNESLTRFFDYGESEMPF